MADNLDPQSGLLDALQQQAMTSTDNRVPDTSDDTPAQPDPSSDHIQFVMNNLEGGGKLTTDSNGAPVRYGINQAANPDVDLKKLTPDSAQAVYRDRYWNKIDGDNLPKEMQLPAISFAANAGTDQANKLIAQSGGDVNKFMDAQKDFYNNLGQNPKYAPQLSGWMDRLNKVQKANEQYMPAQGTQYAQADTGIQTDASPDTSVAPKDPDKMSESELDAYLAAHGQGTAKDPDQMSESELDAYLSAHNTGLPGMGGAENMVPAATAPALPTSPQVPFYGADNKPTQQLNTPVDNNLMLAGSGASQSPAKNDFEQAQQDRQNGVGFWGGFKNSIIPPGGFTDRAAADWAKRSQEADDILKNSGDQSVGENLMQRAGLTAGTLLVDPVMNAAGSLKRYANDIDPALGGAISDIGDEAKSDAGESLNPGINDAGDYIKSNPRLARNLQAMGDLTMAIPMAKPAMEALGAVDTGISDAASKIPSDSFLGNESSGTAKAAPKAPTPTAEEMRANASATYKSLPTDSVAIDAEGTNKFLDDIKKVAPQTRVGQLTAGKDSPLTSLLSRWEGEVDPNTGEVKGGIRNTPLTMAEAQEVDEALGDHIDGEIDKVTGRPTKQGLKLMKVQDSFRQAIDEGGTQGGDQLKLARAQWAQAASMNDIERIVNRAQMMDNPQTGIKTGFRTLASNPNRMKGFTTQEKALINRAATTGVVTDALRAGASRLNTVAALATHGPLAGTATHVLTGAARKGATALQLGRAQDIAKAIASRKMPLIRPAVEAAEAAPAAAEPLKQITFQPDILAGQGADAIARPATGPEQVAAEAERQRRIDLGITPPPKPAEPTVPVNGADLSQANAELAANTFHPTHPDYKNLSYADADAISQSRHNNYDPEGRTPQDQAVDESNAAKQYGTGAPVKNRRVDIIMGPPGAGKSTTLVDPLREKHGSMLIDTDNVKPDLPGWDHGLGANQVHARSKWITEDMPGSVLEKATTAGDNIVYPVIGKDLGRMQKTIDNFRKEGYDVNVHLADIPTEESTKRVIRRFGREGRTVPLSYVQSIGDRPKRVFNQIVKQGKINDYSHYDTSIPKGQEPKLVRAGTNRIREDILGHGQRPIGSSLGTDPEKPRSQGSGAKQGQIMPGASPISESKPIKIHAQGEPDTAITPTGNEFNVRHAVVSGDDLIASNLDDMRPNPNYPQVLQPRDRTSAASKMQVTKYANDLNPRLLMNNPLSSEGAPIISKDGVVESGNGRTLSIKRAMANGTDGAAKYKQALKDAGYNIRGVKNPVLVRIRETPMTDAERIKLAQDSNVRTTLGTSSVEQAEKDAGNLSPSTLNKFMGGDLSQARNREFVKSALKDVVPENEQASVFSKEGALSQEGERRIAGALLHKAYGDEGITRLLTENTDNELSSLGKSLTSAAPEWAKMREDVKSGAIPEDMDKTQMITQAAKQILKARRAGNPVSDYLRTDDMLDPISDEAKGFMKFLHRNEKLTQFKSSDTITNFLNDYARMARQTKSGTDMFGGEPTKGSEVLKAAYKKSSGEPNGQNDLFKT